MTTDSAAPVQQDRAPSHLRLIVVMAITVVIWSVNYTVGKIGFHYMRPMALASFRVLVAGLAMLPVAIWCAAKQRRQNTIGASTRLKRIEPGDLWNFACLGFFGVFLNQGLFTVGLSMTSVGRSAIVVATTPIFILLAAWTQRMERLTTRKVLGLAAAFAGAVVLGAGRDWNLRSTGSQGDLLTFVACLSVVIFTVLGKRMAVAYMGVLSSALCIPLYFWVLRWVPPSKIGSLSYLQPVVGTPFAALVLREPMTSDLLTGGILILAGVYAIESDATHELPS